MGFSFAGGFTMKIPGEATDVSIECAPYFAAVRLSTRIAGDVDSEASSSTLSFSTFENLASNVYTIGTSTCASSRSFSPNPLRKAEIMKIEKQVSIEPSCFFPH